MEIRTAFALEGRKQPSTCAPIDPKAAQRKVSDGSLAVCCSMVFATGLSECVSFSKVELFILSPYLTWTTDFTECPGCGVVTPRSAEVPHMHHFVVKVAGSDRASGCTSDSLGRDGSTSPSRREFSFNLGHRYLGSALRVLTRGPDEEMP
jgi:hypothetical protein